MCWWEQCEQHQIRDGFQFQPVPIDSASVGVSQLASICPDYNNNNNHNKSIDGELSNFWCLLSLGNTFRCKGHRGSLHATSCAHINEIKMRGEIRMHAAMKGGVSWWLGATSVCAAGEQNYGMDLHRTW